MRQATAALDESRRRRVPKDLERSVGRVNAAFAKEREWFKGTQVAVRRGRDGRVLLSMKSVPADDIAGFMAVLRAHLEDAAEG